MRRALIVALACTGCVSDLAVGTSLSRVEDDDSGASSVRDAGAPPHDASDLDARARPPTLDARAEVNRDAGPSWEECSLASCIAHFVSADFCADGGVLVCARPYPDDVCQFACLEDR